MIHRDDTEMIHRDDTQQTIQRNRDDTQPDDTGTEMIHSRRYRDDTQR